MAMCALKAGLSSGCRILIGLAVACRLLMGSVAVGEAPAGLLLKNGDRLAIAGDSITEQKRYSVFIETYLLACRPDLNLSVIQLGWGGERAEGFANRMDNDLVPWKPTVVTTCYGMNDGRYRAYAAEIGANYEAHMRRIAARLKELDVRAVLGSPGVVDSTTYAKKDRVDPAVYNENLGELSRIAERLAGEHGMRFADLHAVMMQTMADAKAALGDAYHVAGPDGVHPAANGHLAMAYAFLRALGFDGALAGITVPWNGPASASDGHKVLSSAGGLLELESSRYPFCFHGGAQNPEDAISILPFLPFHNDLNRFMLTVTELPSARAAVTWGEETKTFSREELAAGINLAAEFRRHPLRPSFDAVLEAVQRKQAYETLAVKKMITLFPVLDKEAENDPRLAAAVAGLRGALLDRQADYQAKARAAVVPVRHTLRIAPESPGP